MYESEVICGPLSVRGARDGGWDFFVQNVLSRGGRIPDSKGGSFRRVCKVLVGILYVVL